MPIDTRTGAANGSQRAPADACLDPVKGVGQRSEELARAAIEAVVARFDESQALGRRHVVEQRTSAIHGGERIVCRLDHDKRDPREPRQKRGHVELRLVGFTSGERGKCVPQPPSERSPLGDAECHHAAVRDRVQRGRRHDVARPMATDGDPLPPDERGGGPGRRLDRRNVHLVGYAGGQGERVDGVRGRHRMPRVVAAERPEAPRVPAGAVGAVAPHHRLERAHEEVAHGPPGRDPQHRLRRARAAHGPRRHQRSRQQGLVHPGAPERLYGVRQPVERRPGAYVVLDTFQSLGTVPVDVRALDPDFACGGVLKWLCGGAGVAYLYVRPELAPKLQPTFTGWIAHESPFSFQVGSQSYSSGQYRFMNGTPNVPALYAARPGLKIIREVGVEKIRAKSKRQTARKSQ